MGVNYSGNPEFAEMPDAEETTNEFGIAVLPRKFGGARDLLDDFLATLKDGDPDDERPDLKLVARLISISYDGPWAYVSVSYKGLRDATMKPNRAFGSVEKTAILTAPDGARMNVTYIAPFARFRYATETRPKAPRFPDKLIKFAGNGIIELNGEFGREVVEGEQASLGVSANSLIPSNDVERFIFNVKVVSLMDAQEQGEGGAWEVTETNEARIVDARRTFPQKFTIVRVG